MIVVVDGQSPEVEDPNIAARAVVDAGARDAAVGAVGRRRAPGSTGCRSSVAEQKLVALYECAYRARLVFAKEQFTRD